MTKEVSLVKQLGAHVSDLFPRDTTFCTALTTSTYVRPDQRIFCNQDGVKALQAVKTRPYDYELVTT